MQDVLNPAVGELVIELIGGWLFGNAFAAIGTTGIALLALALACRQRLPAVLVPQTGAAIAILCAAGLLLLMGMGEQSDQPAVAARMSPATSAPHDGARDSPVL